MEALQQMATGQCFDSAQRHRPDGEDEHSTEDDHEGRGAVGIPAQQHSDQREEQCGEEGAGRAAEEPRAEELGAPGQIDPLRTPTGRGPEQAPGAADRGPPGCCHGPPSSASLGTTSSPSRVTHATGSGPVGITSTRSIPSSAYSSILAMNASTSSSGLPKARMVFSIVPGSRPSASQWRASTSSLWATTAGSGANRLQASAY